MDGWQDDWIKVSEVRFLSRDRDFVAGQNKIISQFASSGAGSSSRLALYLYQELNREVEARAELLVEEFKESLSSVSDLTDQQLVGCDARAEGALQNTYHHLFKQTSISSYLVRFPNLKATKDDSELTLVNAIERAKIDIKRAGAIAMKKQNEAKGINVTIDGHGNVVQVGNYKSTVGLSFTPTLVQSLSSAFDTLTDAIGRSDVPKEVKNELVEVVADCRNELDKQTPNRTRFTGLLTGLATTIQTAGALQPAWEAFKAVAAAAGIQLS